MNATTRIFRAKRIVTMNPSQPFATHVAVRDGRILAVGGQAEMEALGPTESDDRFADAILLPGFVEGHCHLFEGAVWRDPYVGYFDRRGPDGNRVPGAPNLAAVIERLRRAAGEDGGDGPLSAWGFDPIHIEGRRMNAADLDAVSQERPVVITHASGHIMNVNTAALRLAGLDRETDMDGLLRDEAGDLTGELRGFDLLGRIRHTVTPDGLSRRLDMDSMDRFGRIARRVGVTTATDLVSDMSDETIEVYKQATSSAEFPTRIVPAMAARLYGIEEGIARLRALRRHASDSLFFGLVKLHVDGSIQGFTARLRWPGYHNGAPNGLWYIAPSELGGIIEAYHRSGAVLHMHTNGDEATEATVDMLERALIAHPRPDHRHTLQHCQMPDQALYRRIKNLDLCCNIFANHIYYWGEAHVKETMGLARARRMDACGTALRLGIPFAIHSDAPITPLDPLFTAWCAVMRQTAAGRILGEDERIPVTAALHAITLGPAYTLKLDHLIGSIEVGKFADFAALKQDPLEIDPASLKDIEVVATICGGRIFMAAG
ncbi:MAG: amidohydrolase [Acidiphilium sp.]